MTEAKKRTPNNFIPLHVKRASRMIGYCLVLDTQDAWWGLVPVLSARLTVSQRASLAFMALKALSKDVALATAKAATGKNQGAGAPGAPFLSFMDEAAFWTDLAVPEEIEAYCLTTFNAMPPARQCAFLEFTQGRAAA